MKELDPRNMHTMYEHCNLCRSAVMGKVKVCNRHTDKQKDRLTRMYRTYRSSHQSFNQGHRQVGMVESTTYNYRLILRSISRFSDLRKMIMSKDAVRGHIIFSQIQNKTYAYV